jgi:hypothetical protein
MFVERNPSAHDVNDFTKIRAVSGHADDCNINHNTFYPPRLRLERTSNEMGVKGPKHAYFYTNLKGFFNIWDSNGIRPDTSTFGNHSKTIIYMCPVPLDHKDCPDGCQVYGQYGTHVVVVDFELIMEDNIPCFYGYDGRIAVKACALGMLYVEAIIDLSTSAMIYLRNFVKLEHSDYGARFPALADLTDTTEGRKVKIENCFVCQNDVWVGSTCCLHCDSPVLYDHNLPEFKPEDFSLTDQHIREWSKEEKKSISGIIIRGQKAVAKQFEMKFNINTDIPIEEQKGLIRESTRSFAAQGSRADSDICKMERLPFKTEDEIAASVVQLKARIEHDSAFRLRLARKVLTVSSNPMPARILKSQLHRHAYTVALREEEIDLEQLGHRARRGFTTTE